MKDKDKESKQSQTITSAGEVELAEEELDQVSGGWIIIESVSGPNNDNDGVGKIKPKEPDTRWKGEL